MSARNSTLDGLPGLLVSFQFSNSVESGVLEGFEEEVFPEGPGNAAAPKLAVLLQVEGMSSLLTISEIFPPWRLNG